MGGERDKAMDEEEVVRGKVMEDEGGKENGRGET